MGYLNDVSILLSYGNEIRQMSNGVVATTGVTVDNPSLVCVDKNNGKWVMGGYPYNLFKIVNGVVEQKIQMPFTDYPPSGMCVDKSNTIWLTYNGMCAVIPVVNGVAGKSVSLQSASPYTNPVALCGDKDGALWVVDPGMSGMDNGRKAIKVVNGLVAGTFDVGVAPSAICCDRKNIIYVANGEAATISVITNSKTVTTISVAACPIGMCIDKNDALWVLHSAPQTGAGQLTKIVNGAVAQVVTNGINPNPGGICCDNENALWLGTRQGTTISKIINGVVAKTLDIGSPYSISGDATGMQAAILFEGSPNPPQPVPSLSMNQAMSGGM